MIIIIIIIISGSSGSSGSSSSSSRSGSSIVVVIVVLVLLAHAAAEGVLPRAVPLLSLAVATDRHRCKWLSLPKSPDASEQGNERLLWFAVPRALARLLTVCKQVRYNMLVYLLYVFSSCAPACVAPEKRLGVAQSRRAPVRMHLWG